MRLILIFLALFSEFAISKPLPCYSSFNKLYNGELKREFRTLKLSYNPDKRDRQQDQYLYETKTLDKQYQAHYDKYLAARIKNDRAEEIKELDNMERINNKASLLEEKYLNEFPTDRVNLVKRTMEADQVKVKDNYLRGSHNPKYAAARIDFLFSDDGSTIYAYDYYNIPIGTLPPFGTPVVFSVDSHSCEATKEWQSMCSVAGPGMDIKYRTESLSEKDLGEVADNCAKVEDGQMAFYDEGTFATSPLARVKPEITKKWYAKKSSIGAKSAGCVCPDLTSPRFRTCDGKLNEQGARLASMGKKLEPKMSSQFTMALLEDGYSQERFIKFCDTFAHPSSRAGKKSSKATR